MGKDAGKSRTAGLIKASKPDLLPVVAAQFITEAQSSLAERNRVYQEEMNTTLQRRCAEVQAALRSHGLSNLMFYFRLGQLCLDTVTRSEVYGESAFDKIQRALSTKTPTLVKAAQFARVFSADQVEELLAFNGKNGDFQLHWGHVCYLITVEDQQLRRKLAKQAAEEAYTAEELHGVIVQAYGGTRRSGGRPLRRPRSLPSMLRQLDVETQLWNRRYREVWHGDESSLFGDILTLPPDRYKPELAEQLTKAEAALTGMQDAVAEALGLCTRAAARVKAVVATKTKETTSRVVSSKNKKRKK